MQLKTICAVICTIIVFSISVNESAPVVKPPTVVEVKEPVGTMKKPSILPGARTAWSKKLTPQSKKIFNDHKKFIEKKIRTTHKLPAKFIIKPDQFATQTVAGTIYHYLVKIPANKYAYVTVSHREWKKELHGKEENVNVRPQLYSLTDKNI